MELDLDERVPPVQPRSTEAILRIAEKFVQRVAPWCAAQPEPIDLARVIDEELFDSKIEVYPVDDRDMERRGCEGSTSYEDGRFTITISESHWNALFDGGFFEYRARTTVGHELGHAVLHRGPLKEMALAYVDDPAAALHRPRRRDLPPYMDPEWQAWVFCGGILLPRDALRTLDGHPVSEIARAFRVSLRMLRSHIKKLERLGFCEEGGLLVVD